MGGHKRGSSSFTIETSDRFGNCLSTETPTKTPTMSPTKAPTETPKTTDTDNETTILLKLMLEMVVVMCRILMTSISIFCLQVDHCHQQTYPQQNLQKHP